MGTWLDIGISEPRARRRGPHGVVDVCVHGPLNMLSVAEHEQRIFTLVTSSSDDVLLDLSEVTRVSAVGIRMVLYVHSVLERAGRRLLLVGTHPELRRRLRDLGVESLIPLHATRDQALGAR